MIAKLILPFLPILIILFIFAIIAGFLNSATGRGWLGEQFVRMMLWIRLNTKTYRRFHNVTLPIDDHTTQIDHVIVSPFGVFALETKNMGGAIYGTDKDRLWTQKIGNQTHRFQNPLNQNYKHTKTLASCLELDHTKIHSVVVFVGDAKLKLGPPAGVTQDGGCVTYNKSFMDIILTEEEVVTICQKLESERLAPTFATHRHHVENVKAVVANKSMLGPAEGDEPPFCPKCKNQMILRTTKKGNNIGNQFWGCSRFPKCRFTMKPEVAG